MVNQAGVLDYFFQAGFVVKAVMLILLVASLASWTLIFQRAWYFNRIKNQLKQFKDQFWTSSDLSQLYLEMERYAKEKQAGLAAIFQVGFKEYLRIHKQDGNLLLEPVQRVMQIRHAKEAVQMEQHLSWFASIGSIAPYIGLFGTVWGIMASLQALGHAQQATIAMVAPGISEALVATALGLFTAIPAAIAFNRYTTQCNTILDQYELFQEEFIALISQQTDASNRG